ncbi:MAG: NnrS family protein [Mariprofundaceae bacterium]
MMTIQMNHPEPSAPSKKKFALLALGFRPFFLVAGLFAIVLMAIFITGLVSGVWHYNYFPLTLGHAHEMIFGYAAAVMAGFLLTAVRNWTGLDTATGNGLLLLLLLWLAGRVISAISILPDWLVASVDIAFLPVLALVILRPMLKSGQKRSVLIPLILVLMAVGNALIYAEMLGLTFGSIAQGLIIGVGSILMLMSMIGGRVMPFFTERGLPGVVVVRRKWIELLAMPSVAIWLLVELIAPGSIWVVLASFSAAIVHGIRLFGWGNMRIWKMPILWVIHMAYCWLVVGFILQGLAGMEMISATVALHGWTAGAIGMFTYGMMARVSLGHTGRPMAAHPLIIAGFLILALTSVIRVVVPILFPDVIGIALYMAAAGWMIAFALFVWVYAPFLVRPRVDGQPG